MSDTTPFALGGTIPLRPGRAHLPGIVAIVAVLTVAALPLRGLFHGTGASMEEGFMLVFPTLVQEGWVPNVDFLHLYGPASLDALAVWYRVFGDSLESERTFGLLQHLGIIFAIYALARVAGHVAAAGAAMVATFLIITPIGLSALAWHGGLALGLWAMVFAVRGRSTADAGAWFIAGGLAGLALGFRPDLVVAIAITFGWLLRGRRAAISWTGAGALVGLLPMWWHLIAAGAWSAFDGMVIDPVFRLRAGRELPRPPSWNRTDGALQSVAESLPPWWRLPAPTASQQLFLWFWSVIAVAVGTAVWAIIAHRRGGRDGMPAPLVAGAVFGLGVLPQALQRPDSTHLAWVAVVSWPIAVAMVAWWWGHRRPDRTERRAAYGGVAATTLVGIVMLAICPFFTYRTYLLHARVSVGNLPVPFEIERAGRHFWVGDPAVQSAIGEMMPVLDERSRPGDRLFVGPGDLARTVYADTYVYWLYSELEPATYYIEMDPGLADAEGSGMAADIASADFVVLTNTWSGWSEPNISSERRSDEHNRAVADHFCLVGAYHTNLVLLFERCEGGGGFDPSTVAGRAEGVAGGGVEQRDP